MTGSASLSIVVFAYNEAANVASVLSELKQWIAVNEPDAEVLLVDDGSTDGTVERARPVLEGVRHQILVHSSNRGIGAALKTGVKAATATWVTFMPADGQIEPPALGALIQTAKASQSDVVFSVYDHRDDGLDRKILSWGVRALIRIVHGVNLHSDGPYLFKRALFVPEKLPPDTFFLNFEFPIQVLAAGYKTATVTIHCRPRMSGSSKSTGLKRVALVARDLVDLRLRRTRAALKR
jgi:glycosyltransferase involved in cell wall biosynthesis